MPPGPVRFAWLKSVLKELKTLVDAQTFVFDDLLDGEESTSVMEIFKVKINSDSILNVLKMRLVVRGDLQDKLVAEDKWSPTTSFRSLKMFLAHDSRIKARVKQLNFVGAFLQAKTRSRMFVTIPKIFGILFPEYENYCGRPILLAKSMYGTTLSGKYWYMDLLEHLLEMKFKPSLNVPCLFISCDEDGNKIFLLNYVDNMLYFGMLEAKVKKFEELLKSRFDLKFMGQAHWYLSTRISQLQNFDIELDQSRYCNSIVKHYLENAGAKKVLHFHATPLPADFIPMTDDCCADEDELKELETEYNIDFASCIGSLIYLGMTCCDIIRAVNKLAKFSCCTGKQHFEALLHLL